MARKRKRFQESLDQLTVDVLTSLGEGKVYRQSWLTDQNNSLLLGSCEPDGSIHINEAPILAPVLLHELIHRVRPGYTEGAVKRWTAMLFNHLSEAHVARLYELYRQQVDKSKT